MNSDEKEKVGLQCLSDEDLACIVKGDLNDSDELKSQEAIAAFRELSKRTPE